MRKWKKFIIVKFITTYNSFSQYVNNSKFTRSRFRLLNYIVIRYKILRRKGNWIGSLSFCIPSYGTGKTPKYDYVDVNIEVDNFHNMQQPAQILSIIECTNKTENLIKHYAIIRYLRLISLPKGAFRYCCWDERTIGAIGIDEIAMPATTIPKFDITKWSMA